MIKDIEYIFSQIIPPSDREHREGFNNETIIDKLTPSQKEVIEAMLITSLKSRTDVDSLVIETLVYLKSTKVLPLLYKLVEGDFAPFQLLVISSAIFQISADATMVDVGIKNFLKINDKYSIIFAFHHLSLFKNIKSNNLIKKYLNDPEYLISYNATRSYNSLLDD